MKHRINNDEMNPQTECGLEMGSGIKLALANEAPTCKECLKKESNGENTMTNVAQLSVFNGNSTFHSGINNADDLAFLGIHDLHEAYRWYNDHVAFVPHNAIRVLRVAQSVWTFTMTWCRNAHVAVRQDGMSRMPMNWKYSAMNSRTGRMKLLPNLRKSPVTTNAYARFLRHLATGATVNAIDRAASSIPFRVTD